MTRIPTNLEAWLAAVPVRKVEALRDAEGRTVLLRPKFTSPALHWLQRLLPRPTFRVRLDAVGGSLWELCDGQRRVGAVFAELRVGANPTDNTSITSSDLVVAALESGSEKLESLLTFNYEQVIERVLAGY